MGNRGGRIHDPETKTLLKRKWASKRWIICVTKFKNRQREVMGNSYTELFFTDEISALAAGHRPCFECRRKAATRFAYIWQEAFGTIVGSVADRMDNVLHKERTGQRKTLSATELELLPDGSMVMSDGACLAKHGNAFRAWSGMGYSDTATTLCQAVLLTPQSVLRVLENGYRPEWHSSVK